MLKSYSRVFYMILQNFKVIKTQMYLKVETELIVKKDQNSLKMYVIQGCLNKRNIL